MAFVVAAWTSKDLWIILREFRKEESKSLIVYFACTFSGKDMEMRIEHEMH